MFRGISWNRAASKEWFFQDIGEDMISSGLPAE
jgi:hypothetical protein